jgi:hypothetical protein
MIPRRYWTPGMVVALGLVILSAGAAVGAFTRALGGHPLPASQAAPDGLRSSIDGGSPETPPPPGAAALAVEHDPFRPERRPAPERFRLPGEGGATAKPVAAAALPASPLTLIGTAVIGDGGFAMCQRSGEPPKLVRVGETYGDLMLRAVHPGRAVFRAKDGTTMELRVTKAGVT